MKKIILFIFMILFFDNLQAQNTIRVVHNGSLGKNWEYNKKSGKDYFYSYSTIFLCKRQKNEDIYDDSKTNINFVDYMLFGGIEVTAYDETNIENDYVVNGILKGMPYRTVYGKKKIDDTHYKYWFYVDVSGDNKSGVEINALINKTDKTQYSYKELEQILFRHIRELRFSKYETSNSSKHPANEAYNSSEEEDNTLWTIIIGLLSAAAVAGIIRKLKAKKKKNPKKEKEDEAEYILQISRDTIDLTKKKSSSFTVHVWKVTEKGKFPVDAAIEVRNSEPALRISPQQGSGTLKSKLTLKDIPKKSRFTISIVANAEGHTIQKEITIVSGEEKRIVIQTEPDNTRSLRPNLGITLACYAQVVDGNGEQILEETKKIKFKPQSNWIDLSDPILDGDWVAINIGASDPDANAPVSHPPKLVTLSILAEYEEDGKKRLLEKDLDIQLLDCKLDTDIKKVFFPLRKEQSEITFNAFIQDCDEKTPWSFKASYKTEDYRDESKPLSSISITPVSNTQVKIKLIGPRILPEKNEQYIRKMLMIEAAQKSEETLKREIYVTVSKEGLFIEKGVDESNKILIEAKGKFHKELEFSLFRMNEKNKKLEVDKRGLKNLNIELLDKGIAETNIAKALGITIDFDDYVTTIPYARYILNAPYKIPGKGDSHILNYRVSAKTDSTENPEVFTQNIQIEVKTYGIGEAYPDWQKAYEQCKYTIIEYIPDSKNRNELLDLLEKNKYKFDIEGMVELRLRIWNNAYNLMMNKVKGYIELANWYQSIEDDLNWVVWMGDIAFQVVVATYTGAVGGFAASAFKETFLTGVKLIIEGKSVEDFVNEEIESLKQMMYSVAKGGVINTRNIEKVYKGNKLKVWAIYAVATFAMHYQRLGSIPQAAKATARELRDEAIIRFLHQKIQEGRTKAQDSEPKKSTQTDTNKKELTRGKNDYENADVPPDVSGYTKSSMIAIQKIANKLKVTIITRPTNKAAKLLLKSGMAVPKKMFVKNKTINELDTYLGASRRNIGKVGSFEPKMDKAKIKSLPKSLREEIAARYKQRRREWKNQQAHIQENIDRGLIEIKNGVIYDAVAQKPFTGDIDVFDIRGPHGEKLSKAKYKEAVEALVNSNMTSIEHGAHLFWQRWKGGHIEDIRTNEGIFDKIATGHGREVITKKGVKKGEALVVFKSGTKIGGKLGSVYYKGRTDVKNL